MDLLPIAEAIRRRTGKDYHRVTTFHWQTKGIQAGEQRIKLKSVFIGRSRMTTEQWVDEFIEAVTAAKMQWILSKKRKAKVAS